MYNLIALEERQEESSKEGIKKERESALICVGQA